MSPFRIWMLISYLCRFGWRMKIAATLEIAWRIPFTDDKALWCKFYVLFIHFVGKRKLIENTHSTHIRIYYYKLRTNSISLTRTGEVEASSLKQNDKLMIYFEIGILIRSFRWDYIPENSANVSRLSICPALVKVLILIIHSILPEYYSGAERWVLFSQMRPIARFPCYARTCWT